jgi:hypothetical protein
VVEVAPPSDPGVNDPAPVTNREEEAPGEGEDVPPPPVPVDEGNPIPTIPWEDRLDGEQATPGFVWVEVDDLSTTTSIPTTMTPTTAAPLTEPAEAPPGAVGDDPSTIVEIPLVLADGDMPELSSEPTPWRRTVFDTATSLGDWIAGVAAWVPDTEEQQALGLGLDSLERIGDLTLEEVGKESRAELGLDDREFGLALADHDPVDIGERLVGQRGADGLPCHEVPLAIAVVGASEHLRIRLVEEPGAHVHGRGDHLPRPDGIESACAPGCEGGPTLTLLRLE